MVVDLTLIERKYGGDMRFILLAGFLSVFIVGQSRADSLRISEASISRIAQRFRAILDTAGINGVGRDILNCYNENLDNSGALKECVAYDYAALIVDRVMLQIFTAQGVNAAPAALFTDRVFEARQNTYGRIAFRNEIQDTRSIRANAQKIVEKVMPR